MSTVHKNAIITGHFDAYCLLCDAHLKQNAEEHITDPGHKTKLQESFYIENYKIHHIRKVSVGYYCEFCNVLLPTLAKVRFHVTSKEHKKHKDSNVFTKINENVIAFNQVVIDQKAWHGLIDDTCFICNVDFTDEKEHLESSNHILKLIQGEVVTTSFKHKIYRNVDSITIQCMVCNVVLEVHNLEAHFEDNNHMQQFHKRCIDDTSKLEQQNKLKNKSHENTSINDHDKVAEKENPVKQKENEIKSNLNNNNEKNSSVKAENVMKVDVTDQNIENKSEIVEDKINMKTQEDKIRHPFEAITEVKTLAKTNKIVYKHGKQSAYCKVCNVTISSSLKRIKEHIEEETHKNNLDEDKARSLNTGRSQKILINLMKKSTFDFIDTTVEATLFFENLPREVLLNNKYCISYFSFHFLTVNDNVIRCQACEKMISSNTLAIKVHEKTYNHCKAVLSTPVITIFQDEFIREVRPDFFHCGYCNLIPGNFENLTCHLESTEHIIKTKEAKTKQFLFF